MEFAVECISAVVYDTSWQCEVRNKSECVLYLFITRLFLFSKLFFEFQFEEVLITIFLSFYNESIEQNLEYRTLERWNVSRLKHM